MKFADAFTEMGQPQSFTVKEVKQSQTKFGLTYILELEFEGNEVTWFVKPEKFDDLFSSGAPAPGAVISVVQNPPTRPGGYPFYTLDSMEGETQAAPVAKPKTFSGKGVQSDKSTEYEKTGYRAGLAGVWQALVVSGMAPEIAFEEAPKFSRELRKMADEMYYSDIAAGE